MSIAPLSSALSLLPSPSMASGESKRTDADLHDIQELHKLLLPSSFVSRSNGCNPYNTLGTIVITTATTAAQPTTSSTSPCRIIFRTGTNPEP